MRTIIAVLAAALFAPSAFAGEIGFGPGESMSARDVVTPLNLEAFVHGLGDVIYEGTSGTLSLNGEKFSIIETRVATQRKTLNGHTGEVLRIYLRAAKDSNPAHVEAFSEELSLEVRGDGLSLVADGTIEALADLEGVPTPRSLALSFAKPAGRYRPAVRERLALTLSEAGLCVERTESILGAEKTRETFCAPRR
jgi:hypothetical protein